TAARSSHRRPQPLPDRPWACAPRSAAPCLARAAARGAAVRAALARRSSGRLSEPGPGAVEPPLADRRELLAALPEGQRLLQRGAACLEPAHHVDELVPGVLVARVVRFREVARH